MVSRETHRPLFRYTNADCAVRARRLAKALAAMGLEPGAVVGSIAWDNHRHLEACYAVSGSGMVMHTCNPRLHPQQLVYIINHAQDQVVLFDAHFAPLVKAIAAACPKVRAWVCLAEAAHTPAIEGVAGVIAYEDLIAPHDDAFDWPELDGASLYELIKAERVTVSAGVPTIWQGLISHMDQHGLRFSTMRRTGAGG